MNFPQVVTTDNQFVIGIRDTESVQVTILSFKLPTIKVKKSKAYHLYSAYPQSSLCSI